MRLTNTIKLEIKHNSVWTDYSDGIIDIGIIRGIQGYEEIWQLPEAGVLTIVTRNSNIDPYVNDSIRMGKDIRIKSDNNVLFTGKLSGINVDYQPKGKPQITTLTAVDMIGTMALHALSDGFTEQLGGTMNAYDMFNELTGEISGWVNSFREQSPLWPGNAAGATPSGSNALNVLSVLARTQLQFFYADINNNMYLYNRMDRKKDDLPKIQFDSRGGATSYQDIELTDGFEVLTNQLSIRNQGYNSNRVPLYTNSYSLNQWGNATKTLTVQIQGLTATQQDITDDIKDIVFADSAHPSKEIYSITWDGTLNKSSAATIDILDNVYIYHEVDPEDISREYGVIGIEHRISDDNWEVKYYLKNHFIFDTIFPQPIIESDHPLGATINDDVTYSISNIGNIDTTSATYAWKYEAGTTGNVVGSTFSTAQSPIINYALANVGDKYISCTVTDSYGFVRKSQTLYQQIVGAAPINVSFTYTIDPINTAALTVIGLADEVSTYSWDFGDGTVVGPYTNNTYTHVYEESGTYAVKLIANNAYGSTESTPQNITITVPVVPTDEVGSWGLRYLKFSMPLYTAPIGAVWNGIKLLQCNTSYTNTNRASGAFVDVGLATEFNRVYDPSEPFGNHVWYEGTNTTYTSSIPNNGVASTPENAIRTSTGIWPRNTVSGNAHWSIIIDLNNTYYDVKTIVPTLYNMGAPSGRPNLNVYASTYTGTSASSIINGPWTLIGTINKDSGVFTPNQTMPLNLP